MAINAKWHKANRMPKNATFEQKVKWHTEHNQNCNCRPGFPKKLAEEMEKKKENKKKKN
jgi:hypothetical protein